VSTAHPHQILHGGRQRPVIGTTQEGPRYIAEADEAFPGRPFTVRTLPGGHSPFAARPGELAAALVP
jgi:hypothetical protein